MKASLLALAACVIALSAAAPAFAAEPTQTGVTKEASMPKHSMKAKGKKKKKHISSGSIH